MIIKVMINDLECARCGSFERGLMLMNTGELAAGTGMERGLCVSAGGATGAVENLG